MLNHHIQIFYSFDFEVLGINNKLVCLCIVNSLNELKVYVYEIVENKWVLENDLVKYNLMLSADASFIKYPQTW